MRETATVRIESIAAGGAGVAHLDGMAVFVPRSAPGDLADIEVWRRKRFAEGRLRRVTEASPDRVPPRCAHYDGDFCGGCQLQHLSDSAQRAAKKRIVYDAFARIARRTVEVDEVVPSPSAWAYRNKLTLTLRYEGGRWIAGLRRLGAPDALFALRECPITAPSVLDGWRQVIAASASLPRAKELRGAVRSSGDDLSLVLEGGDAWPAARAFVETCPALSLVLWIDRNEVRHMVHDRRRGDATAAAFAQVNPPVAQAIRERVVSLVEAERPESVVDAYAGSGALSARLVGGSRRVVAIERDREAVQRAQSALGDRARVVRGAVEDHLADELPADVVVLNPPRGGVDARVCDTLQAATPRPRLIVYVSCDPATLARDVGRLPAYHVRSVTPFDMFPQTAHVETVCTLVPEVA